jgi:RNA-directed DNA polymerase
MTRMAKLMARLGLEVNTTKARTARLPEEHFDLLGYTVGRFYGKDGRPYIGTRPAIYRSHGGRSLFHLEAGG